MPVLAMPRLSDTMEEGTIVAWLKQPGERVAAGEDVVEIETDKATMACQAEADGPLTILAEAGETHPVGHPIARIGEEDGAAAEVAPAAGASPTPADDGPPPAAPPSSSPVPAAGAAGDVRASPVARRMARRLGVDLGAVAGSGPRGRVQKADVEAHADAPRPAAAPAPVAEGGRGAVAVEPLSRIQRTIAERMLTAKTTAPEFVLEVDVDMTAAVALRDERRRLDGDDPLPSLNDLVVRASALALREFPRANGAFGEDGFALFERINVGVAVAADDALVVPTIFDADRKALGRIAEETRALAQRVRDGSIAPADLGGGTFTVSNLGMFGIDRFTAVLNPPQAAILAVGRVALQPRWDEDAGGFVPRSTMRLSLTCDHRILYGADAARFLGRIRERLEAPLRLAL
ncbi:dihydrolipoamide acetyltransferase family protein [Patulibacter defluvii]|uniref:dihydrolipoamide acetyltransferase family protein n=1 Tax=Patulibacter defluvii TaxID=3095358 RepID=UPI002A76378D|nr:dihydrolipoamide acetyltransferase family protein [Patulibacter sp. DM4]